MAFKGRDPVRTKIVIQNKIIESLKSFNYLGNISYERELEIDNKLNNYLKITGILNNVFRPQKTLKKTRIKLHNTLAGRPSQCCYMAAKRGLSTLCGT
jgi:hypothetical protein